MCLDELCGKGAGQGGDTNERVNLQDFKIKTNLVLNFKTRFLLALKIITFLGLYTFIK